MSYTPYQPPPYSAAPQFDPYGPPPRPAVFLWYVLYCACMALIYLLCVGAGATFFLLAEEIADEEMSAVQARVMGVIFAVIGLPLMLVFLAGPFLPKNKLGWIVGCVNIGIGLTSGCTMLPCVFLIIYWLKPETRHFYGMHS